MNVVALILMILVGVPLTMIGAFLFGVPYGLGMFAAVMAASLATSVLKLGMARARGVRGRRSMRLVFLAHMSSVPVGLLVAAVSWLGLAVLCESWYMRDGALPMTCAAWAVTAGGFAWATRMESLYYRKYTNMDGAAMFVVIADAACYLAVVAVAVLVWRCFG